MWLGIVLIVCNLIYSILIGFVYFSKKRIDVLETKLYGNLVVLTAFFALTFRNKHAIICNRL